jgi:hypothetical protein
MWTKSKIQMIKENLNYKDNFRNAIDSLMEKYTIEDSIFTYKNELFEVTRGYFDHVNNYNSLNEAINNIGDGMVIRVKNNQEFEIGYLRTYLNECKSDRILDINNATLI